LTWHLFSKIKYWLLHLRPDNRTNTYQSATLLVPFAYFWYIQIIRQLFSVESYKETTVSYLCNLYQQRLINNFYSNFYLMYRCNVLYNLNLIGSLLLIHRRHRVKELFWLLLNNYYTIKDVNRRVLPLKMITIRKHQNVHAC
jgi:hypothetical protein